MNNLLTEVSNLNFKVISLQVKPENSYHLLYLAENWPQKNFHGVLFQETDFFRLEILKHTLNL